MGQNASHRSLPVWLQELSSQGSSEGPGKEGPQGSTLTPHPLQESLPQLLRQVEPQGPQHHFRDWQPLPIPCPKSPPYGHPNVCPSDIHLSALLFPRPVNIAVNLLFEDNDYPSFHLALSFSVSIFPLSIIINHSLSILCVLGNFRLLCFIVQ